ncbi:crossover junction endodeoxyribonuclease RuvC [Nakamurella antarctica]|uniref:Crossover junction endodeoxyribonuclease RuvC n=1 Tax=Nakamurella antarctica TaxID=1902245 RepID=A0A3G8ZUN6_9ACTN|nr:crossover junction endodeoxyribonuclease RuvC [Nakamurella antarctica]AZI57726.1 crossover junction endodeoxyribonuclease RuvC [Nakamurella antarctica]
MRVLGVDPGLTRCGVGVVDEGLGRRWKLIDVSVARTPSGSDLAHRLLSVASHVEAAMDLHRPDAVAIERVFSQQNVLTVIGVAQATGVVALAAARRGIPVAWHTPSEVKAAVTGSGVADKAQVTFMITKLLRLTAAPKPADAADALALAMCHLMRSPLIGRLAAVQQTGKIAAAEAKAAGAPPSRWELAEREARKQAPIALARRRAALQAETKKAGLR